MLDPDEQYEIVKAFAMKHIVPHMRAWRQDSIVLMLAVPVHPAQH